MMDRDAPEGPQRKQDWSQDLIEKDLLSPRTFGTIDRSPTRTDRGHDRNDPGQMILK